MDQLVIGNIITSAVAVLAAGGALYFYFRYRRAEREARSETRSAPDRASTISQSEQIKSGGASHPDGGM